MATLFQLPKQVPVFAGESLPGARLYFFQSGTLTPIVTYTTAALSVAHAHPVVADGDGVFAPIFFNEAVNATYRMQLKTSADVLKYDVDSLGAFPRNPNFDTIELGNASDTTLSRASAGTMAVEGVNVLTTATGMPIGVTGSYTGTFTGCTTSDTVTIRYAIAGSVVSLHVIGGIAVSNATTFTITGAPAAIWPATAQLGYSTVYAFTNNGAVEYGTVGVRMSTSGILQFARNNASTGFTNSGNKGPTDFLLTYNLV